MPLDLQEGAIFLTDAHYPRHKDELLALFDAFLASPPPQLFLLGDIFEFLSPSLPYSVELGEMLIEKINAISKLTEVFYIEGNHDFLVSKIFPNANVYTINEQPIFVRYKDKKIAIMHGDKYERLRYRIYAALIRSNITIKILRLLTFDIKGRFAKKLYAALLKKNLCRDFDGFENKKRKMLSSYDIDNTDILIEGHYHRRVSFKQNALNYEALSAFACNKSFFKVEFTDNDISFVEMSLGALKYET
jgi:UDP-2,3-diacylglucosamine hydrolase